MAVTLTSIDLLSDSGRFHSWSPAADLPELRRYCLYYGFSGTGKSSIARALGDMGRAIHERPKNGAKIRLSLSNGSSIGELDEALDLRNRIFVFSSEFVDDNFRWKDGFATPVFYIGKSQSDIALRLNELRERLPKAVERQSKARSRLVKADKVLTEFRRDRARQIETELGANRSYRSPNLEADYAGFNGAVEVIPPSEAAALRSFLASVGQFSNISLRGSALQDIPGLRFHALADLLGHVPHNDALETLKSYPEMQGWAVDGAKYHIEKALDWCLHCGEGIAGDAKNRLDWLNDDRITRFREELSQASVAIERSRSAILSDQQALPPPAVVVPSLRKQAEDAHTEFMAAAEALDRQLSAKANQLSVKSKTINSQLLTLPGFEKAYEEAFGRYRRAFSEMALILEKHNSAIQNAEEEVAKARAKLKNLLLATGYEQFRTLSDEVRELRLELQKADEEVKGLAEDITDLESQLRDHRAAAELISSSITRYLGHRELTIEAEDEGFRICRDGSPVKGPLSEGERTAIAFCYFLTLLEAEGRRLADTIVVLDDPISSLDSGALNYTASLIAAKLEGAGQVIILTHNVHFMHEIKKWIRRVEGSRVFKDHLASLYFIENFFPTGSGKRQARIVRMSKLLHSYESEYHFIFDLILKCAREPVGDEAFTYLLPNALRKLLDTFLAFKEPKSESIESRVARIANEFEALDETRLHSVMRMLNTESHADAISDGSTLSPIPIEETQAACRAVLHFIRVVDQRHFEVMCDVCGCDDALALAA